MTRPCVCCGKELELTLCDPGQDPAPVPRAGTCFWTRGNYGSTVFDPMNGCFLELVVCDVCLLSLAERGSITLLSHDAKIGEKWDGRKESP